MNKTKPLTDQRFEHLDELIALITMENENQLEKWGIQNRLPSEWMMFLTEEVGELAESISEWQFRRGPASDVVKEAIQTATLALKIAEMYEHLEHPQGGEG